MEIINPAQLRTIPENENAVIVDARSGADAFDRFKTGHLKGAVFADLETNLSDKTDNAANGGRHPLPEPGKFGRFLAGLGISTASYVVVYDDKRGANAAARFWWMLKAAGHEQVQVVSGGLEALVQEGFVLTTDDMSFPDRIADYPLNEWKLPLADLQKVLEAFQDEKYLIIDVRENYRYRGESEPIDLVAGHIPGAMNVPFSGNLLENGTFLSATELAEKYKSIIQERKPENVIVHCGSGVTACHTLLALAEAGITGASLYVGSWSEWSRNDLPVATEH